MQKEKMFDSFTNIYKLSKTLRFGLKPVGETEKFLKTSKIFEKDETINESYKQAKFYFDELHKKFVNFALSSEGVKDIKLKNLVEAWKNQKKDKRRWEDEQKKFQKEIVKLFNEETKRWKKEYEKKDINFGKTDLGGKGVHFLLSAGVLGILKYEFPREKGVEFVKNKWPSLFVKERENLNNKRYIFDSFDNFSTYLSKFQENRKNLYKDDGTSTSIASRILQNLTFFLQNREIFNNKQKIYRDEIGIVGKKSEIFNVKYYKKCLLQKGIDDYNRKIGKLNQKIKELCDKRKKEEDFKKSDYQLFRVLYKQILSEVGKQKQLIERKEDVLSEFREFVKYSFKFFNKANSLINKLFQGNFIDYYDTIYLKNTAINTVSYRWFTPEARIEFEMNLPQKSKNKSEKDIPKIKTFVSLTDIKVALEQMNGDVFKENYITTIGKIENKWQQFLKIWEVEFNELWKSEIDRDNHITRVGYKDALREAKKYLSSSKYYSGKKKEIRIIKNFADSGLKIYQMFKYLMLSYKKQSEIPSQSSTEFYRQYDELYLSFDFIKYYNAFRNFLTKKLSDTDKIKLNFDNGQLLGGWDESQEKNKLGVVLRKDNLYYLVILNKKYNKVFDEKENPEAYKIGGDYYEKMVYKCLADIKRQIPRIAFAQKNRSLFGWNKEIQKIKEDYKLFQENKKNNKDLWGKSFNKNKETKLIKYYQNALEKGGYKDTFGLCWKEPSKYKGIGEFNDDIDRQAYSLRFVPIDTDYIRKGVDNGKFYLFEITNKDIRKNNKKTKDNLHTMYFEQLFSKENLKDIVLKLSGGAEIFRRERVKNLPKRKDNNNKEVIEHKRYAEDKLLFHLPIVLNMRTKGMKAGSFNSEIRKKLNKALRKRKDKINVIGIDRGEKHLAYYSIINHKGEILAQESLNKINGTDYQEKLHEREKERLKNRQSWEPITKIKDLKRGYISGVIHKLSRLVIDHNAILVLEDLNMRFKQTRSRIEKSIYQQLEKALIDKFGYVVFKDNNLRDPGGVLNGYQLSAPFESFQKMKKQTGIIFYTQADYTSTTDPLTGFRKNVYVKNSAPIGEFGAKKKSLTIKKWIELLKELSWDKEKKSYIFKYDVKDFYDKAKSKVWKIYADIPRIRRFKENGYWKCDPVNPNEMLKKLFQLWNFDETKGNILKEIKEKDNRGELKGKKDFDGKKRTFYHSLVYIFNLILQIRNSFSKKNKLNKEGKIEEAGEDIDFIASPVYPFFTTKSKYSSMNFSHFNDKIKNNKTRIMKDFNGDANGAYNIARKGIMLLNRIKENPERPNLYITKEEWDEFSQR